MIITKSQVAAVLEALNDEKAGYQRRLDGGEESMKDRIADVNKSIAFYKKQKGDEDEPVEEN